MAGISLGAVVITPAGGFILEIFGWRATYLFLGLCSWVLVIPPILLFMKNTPQEMGLLPDGDSVPGVDSEPDSAQKDPFPAGMRSFSLPEAARTRSYWLLVFGHAGINIPLMGGLSHTAAWGVDILRALRLPVESGMEVIQFGIFLSAMAAVIGALVGGPLSDRVGRKPVFTASFIMYGSSMLYGVMVTTTVPSLSGIICRN